MVSGLKFYLLCRILKTRYANIVIKFGRLTIDISELILLTILTNIKVSL